MAEARSATEKAVMEQIDASIALHRYLISGIKTLLAIADRITLALRRGNTVFLFGNGGSAADAQHIASELSGRFRRDRDPLPAITLSANVPALTAIANDFGYEEVFARQVKGLVKQGDVVIGISTSGQSPSVLRGMEAARGRGATTIALTGAEGRLRSMVDYALSIPSADTPRIQEAHITAAHVICYLVEEALAEESS